MYATIVLAQPPYFIFDFLFVAGVSSSEGLRRFTYVLATALLAGTKINYEGALAVDFLLYLVDFECVRALECFALCQN